MDFLYSQLESLEYSFIRNGNFGKTFNDRLDRIAQQVCSQKVEDNTYLKLLQIYYYKYEKERNIKGMRYCLLRMQQVNSYKKNRRLRLRYPELSFSKLQTDSIHAFLSNKNSLYLDMVAQFIKELLFVDTCLSIFFMVFFVYFCQMNFYIGCLLSVFIYFLVFFVSQYNLKEPRVDIRCSILSRNVAMVLKKVDVSLRR